jgi:hypothetical protein
MDSGTGSTARLLRADPTGGPAREVARPADPDVQPGLPPERQPVSLFPLVARPRSFSARCSRGDSINVRTETTEDVVRPIPPRSSKSDEPVLQRGLHAAPGAGWISSSEPSGADSRHRGVLERPRFVFFELAVGNGPGIPRRSSPGLRAVLHDEAKDEGSGMGSAVYTDSSEHGGTIAVDSARGAGQRFAFHLRTCRPADSPIENRADLRSGGDGCDRGHERPITFGAPDAFQYGYSFDASTIPRGPADSKRPRAGMKLS